MRVLIIFSWDDQISKARQERMRLEARLQPYEIHQGFAVPSSGSSPHTEELFRTISAAIEISKPEVLLLHTGAAYERSPEAFTEAFLRIREKYPTLRLGYQRLSSHMRLSEHRRMLLETPRTFGPNGEIRAVGKLPFGRLGPAEESDELSPDEDSILGSLGIFEDSGEMKNIENDFFA